MCAGLVISERSVDVGTTALQSSCTGAALEPWEQVRGLKVSLE